MGKPSLDSDIAISSQLLCPHPCSAQSTIRHTPSCGSRRWARCIEHGSVSEQCIVRHAAGGHVRVNAPQLCRIRGDSEIDQTDVMVLREGTNFDVYTLVTLGPSSARAPQLVTLIFSLDSRSTTNKIDIFYTILA